MKRLLLAASIALALSPALAFASPSPDAYHQGRSQDHRRDDDRRGHHDRRPEYRHDNGRHLGWYKQSFKRGQRVPVVYLQPRYYVTDYRAYGLYEPPSGYRWVRPYGANTDEYLLVQLATGLITQVLGY
jgi:Ni/Co efflux regulator RcnB